MTSAPSIPDDAGVGALEACDQAQQRGLAAARGPQQREELAGIESKIDPVDGGHRVVAARDAVEPHDGRGISPWASVAERSRRWESSTSVKLNSITIVAIALISGVTPKRIIE